MEDSAAAYTPGGGLSHGTSFNRKAAYAHKDNTFDAEERRAERNSRTKLALARSEYVQKILITPDASLQNLPIKQKQILLNRNHKLKGYDL